LESNGFTILSRNFRCKNGEIDLIAVMGSLLVFVEVKARATSDFGYSTEFVNREKRKRILKCSKYFMQKNNLNDMDIRFDIIGFDNEKPTWIKNILMEEF